MNEAQASNTPLARFNSQLKKSLLNRLFKNSKCKEQKKFKVDVYLDRFEFELYEATQQLGDFQLPVRENCILNRKN